MKQNEAEEQLTPKLTPEFLETLMFAARTYGHEGDYEEVARFVMYCNSQAGHELSQPFPRAFGEDEADAEILALRAAAS